MTAMPRVLIVDDNELNVELARFVLTQAGIQVAAVLDANQALDQVERFAPDLILMDIQMPGRDGIELTRELRAREPRRQLVIVAFTAYAMKGDRERFLAAGCDAYIAKPIDVATFAGEVRALLPPAR